MPRGIYNRILKRKTIICCVCSSKFKIFLSRNQKFCSHLCYSKSLNIKGEKPNCMCGKKLSSHRSILCMECAGKAKIGNKHWNWQGGKSNNRDIHSLNNREYRDWRQSVFKRDGFTCRIADVNCDGQLQAHHILRWADYPELRFEINNGITLCVAHHPRKKKDEAKLLPYFNKLVAEVSLN